MDFCTNPSVLQLIYLFKIVIRIMVILLPIIILIKSAMDTYKAVVSNKPQDEIKDNFKKLARRIAAALIIFFIPTIVSYAASEFLSEDDISACFTNANLEKIEELKEQKEEERLEQVEQEKEELDQAVQESYQEQQEAIQEKEEQEQQQQQQSQQQTGSEENLPSGTYTNKTTGIKYNLYEQRGGQWQYLSFPGKDGTGTVGDRGCNMIAVAVVASAADSKITPYEVYYSGYKSAHPYDAVNNITNNAFSCSMTSATGQDIKSQLQQGNPVITLVYGSDKGGSSPFTGSQHYMALLDINEDGTKIYVGNSYENGKYSKSKTGWYDSTDVLTSVQQAHTCVPGNNLK